MKVLIDCTRTSILSVIELHGDKGKLVTWEPSTVKDRCVRSDDGHNSCYDYAKPNGVIYHSTQSIVISERNGLTHVTVSRWVETQQ